MPTIEVGAIKHQYEFLHSTCTNTALVAGYGSGKTFAGVLKTIIASIEEGKPVAYFMPSYGMIRDTAFPEFANLLTLMGIKYKLNKSEKIFYNTLNPKCGPIILRSMDDPESIKGFQVAYSLIDEADVPPKKKMQEVFQNIVGRTRLSNKKNRIDFVSTPEGFNFLYDFFVLKENVGDKKLIKAKTLDNPFIPPDFIDNMYSLYTPEQIKAYINGEFVNLNSGSVYDKYNRDIHDTKVVASDSDVLLIGMDFNITNMSATIIINKSQKFYVVDEITGAYDTNELSQKILDKYPNRMIVYPDASCKARKTVGFSDYDILKRYFSRIDATDHNPSVRQRVNLVNGLFMNARKETALYINRNKCPKLSQALEALSYDKNGEPDKKSGNDHVTDALGYPLFRILRPNYGGRVVAQL